MERVNKKDVEKELDQYLSDVGNMDGKIKTSNLNHLEMLRKNLDPKKEGKITVNKIERKKDSFIKWLFKKMFAL